MRPVFLINDAVLFEPDKRRLCPLAGYPERGILLHGPVSECLLQLLEHNGEILTQRFLFAAVWEKQGAIVTTNALYQTIASIRKALKAAGLAENVVQTVPKEGFRSVAHIQAGVLDAFIKPAVETPIDTSPEQPDLASPVLKQPPLRRYFSTKSAYALAGLLFIASCSVLYFQIKDRHAVFGDYQHIGNTAGCNVYSSWHDKTKSQHIFTELMARYPVQCSAGSVAYMTLNRFQDGISVIVCDKQPDIKDARCDSVMYMEHYHENE